MKIKYIVYAILIIGLGALVGYRVIQNKKKGGEAAGPVTGGPGGPGKSSVMRVNGVVLKPQSFANTVSVSGSIEANEQVQIRSQVSGLVRSIYFKEGSQVTKGQVLLKIDDAELTAQLAQVQTQQSLASENEKRAKLLLQKEAISQQEYDVAQADLKSGQAQSQLIRAQLAKTTIRAPFSGQIGLRSISEGEYISPDIIVARLVNSNPIKISFSIPEKYSGQVKVNTDLHFTVSGSNEKYKATVYAIEPGIEATTRTLQLRARADNSNGALLPGSFATVHLPLTTIQDALLVPTQAIIPVQNGKKVFVSEGGKAKEVMVETSTRTEKDVLVTSGLKAGDTVLTTGIMTLKAGNAIVVKAK